MSVRKIFGSVPRAGSALSSGLAMAPLLAIGLTFFAAPPVVAGTCTVTPGGDWICSGPANPAGEAGININAPGPVVIDTDPGFGLNVNNGIPGLDITASGGISFTDTNESSIVTSGGAAIDVGETGNGDIEIRSNGSLTATAAVSYGVNASNVNTSGNIVVHTKDTDGVRHGIYVQQSGTGLVDINSSGLARGRASEGIRVWTYNAGSGVNLRAHDVLGGTEGIFVHNSTSGAAEIVTTGLVKGESANGILVRNLSRATSVSVTAADVQGQTAGIYVANDGTGATMLSSTGTISGTFDSGVVVATAASSGGLNVAVRDVQGEAHGLNINHQSISGHAALITTTGHVRGGADAGSYAINAMSAAGQTMVISVDDGSVVGALSGNAIRYSGGNGIIDVASGATVNGRIDLGVGDDRVTLRSGLSGTTVLDGGGGINILNVANEVGATRSVSDIRNWAHIYLDNSSLALIGGNIAVGTAGDMTTGIFLVRGATLDGSQDNFSLTGNLHVGAGSRFIGAGDGIGNNLIAGNVRNAGLVSSEGGVAGNRLRVQGNYIGSGGVAALESMLGDDTSVTDRFEIAGDTSGSSLVRIVNRGGVGAQTVEGLEIISVAGASNGVFALQGDYQINNTEVVVGGAYAYRLAKGNVSGTETNNWYLRSELLSVPGPLYQEGVATYETYSQALQGLNTIATLQQRVGNRFWLNPQNSDSIGDAQGLSSTEGLWGLIEGAHRQFSPQSSDAQAQFDQSVFKLRIGMDGAVNSNEYGTLVGGVSTHYSRGSVNARSFFGDGRIDSAGAGLGGSLTWYGNDGLYVDGQAQATWYQSDLRGVLSNINLVTGNGGFGYAVSLEAGQQVAIDEGWSITPQAQMVYLRASFDNFADVYGAAVSFDRGGSLEGRLGLQLDREAAWLDESGLTRRASAYAIGNLYYEFLGDSRVDVAGTSFASQKDRLWGGLGVGGTYSWDDGAFSVYGEALAAASLANMAGNYAFEGKVGLRAKW